MKISIGCEETYPTFTAEANADGLIEYPEEMAGRHAAALAAYESMQGELRDLYQQQETRRDEMNKANEINSLEERIAELKREQK